MTLPRQVGLMLAAVVLPFGLTSAYALDPSRAVLVREMQFPKISLNLNVAFATSDLRIPISADPAADAIKVEAELKKADSPSLHLQLARLWAALAEYEKAGAQYGLAIDGYATLVENEPDNARAHQEFAEALIALGMDAEAAAEIEEALIADDTLSKAHELSADMHAKHAVMAYEQGMVQLMFSHLAAAEEEASEAIRLAPDDPHPYVMLFIAKWLPSVLALQRDPKSGLAELGKFEEMSKILEKAAQKAPTYPKLRQYAVACKMTPFFAAQMAKGLDAGVWEDLDQQQRRVLTSARDDLLSLANEVPDLKSDALLSAAVACFMMGDSKTMYQKLRASADADPESTAALEANVAFLAHEKKWAQALVVAEETKQRRPSGKAYTWIGRIYAEQKKWKQAEEAFRLAMSYDDATAVANLGLGVVLLKSNASAYEALLPLRTAWQEGPGDPEFSLAWGIVLTLVGEVDEGKKYVEHALSQWQPSPGLRAIAKEFGIEVQ